MQVEINNSILELTQGDITAQDTVAIVNPANTQLIMGGGVAGVIRAKGGPAIQQQCRQIGSTVVGGAVKTTAGNLKAEYVIHAVGPRMNEGDEDNKLRNATLNSLSLCDSNNITSISFPAISTGIFGFPIKRCAKIMLKTTIDYLKGNTQIQKVLFCLFTKSDFMVFEEELKKQLSNESNAS